MRRERARTAEAQFAPPRTAGFTVTESAGSWGAPARLSLSAQFETSAGQRLNSISCAAVRACMAVGYYEDEGIHLPFAASDEYGMWYAAPIAVPANGQPGAGTALESIACPAAKSCIAVGQYETSSAAQVPMAADLFSSDWSGRATEITPTPGSGSGPGLSQQLASVACPRARTCTAVGSGAGPQHTQAITASTTPGG